jgi:hypothetical protein
MMMIVHFELVYDILSYILYTLLVKYITVQDMLRVRHRFRTCTTCGDRGWRVR